MLSKVPVLKGIHIMYILTNNISILLKVNNPKILITDQGLIELLQKVCKETK